MRIAMMSWESMHSIAIGGLAPHVTELSSALIRLGHEVHVFTRIGTGQTGYDCVDGVHYHRCPYEPHVDFLLDNERMNDSFVWHLAETEAFLGRPFDIIHGHDWLSVRSLRRAKNDHGRPLVLTIHSTEFGRCGNSLWDDDMSNRIRDLEWEGAYLADRVICVSKTLCGEVHRLYNVPMNKMHAVYNGVDPRKYEGYVDVSGVRRSHTVGLDDPMVLFAGRMTWQKGPDMLVEAVPGVLREHPRAKIVFAGDGDMRSGLESRAESLGISRATRFLGHRSGRDLVGLFRSADLVCVPSRNEPFGIVILEAWSAGKPVVATRTGGPAEFVRDEYNGLTVVADAEPIGHGIGTLIADKEGARQMGENGRRDAESRFSWDHSAADTQLVYEAVLEHRNGLLPPDRSVEGVSNMLPTKTNSKSGGAGSSSTRGRVSGGKSAWKVAFQPTPEQIQTRAYEIFLARNGAPGDPVDDWLRAERELRERMRIAAGTRG